MNRTTETCFGELSMTLHADMSMAGTGKSLIARSVAAACGAHVVAIDAGSMTSSVYGETETKLKACFDEVRQRLDGDDGAS